MRHSGSIRVRSRDKKETAVCGVVHSSMQETLLKNEKHLEDDWLIGDESWKEKKNLYHIRLSYYVDAEAAKEGQESEYEYVIRFDARDGFIIQSQGVPEKEMNLSGESTD